MHNLRYLIISSLHRELSPTRMLKWPGHSQVQNICNISSVYYVQDIGCHVVWQLSY